VLTGILEIAMLENMCPPTWNAPIGRVVPSIARVGLRILENRMTGVINRPQYDATKANWINVRVMGYRNWFIIDLPVFEDIADVAYHREHKRMNLTVDA
jgi:hypothetical protein